jgi:hypothetical protein
MPNVPVPCLACAAGVEDRKVMVSIHFVFIMFVTRPALPGCEGGQPSYADSWHPDQGLVDILSSRVL